SIYGSTMACVGQISIQALHEPQCAVVGPSNGNSSEVNNSPKTKKEPDFFSINNVCLPVQPIPAFSAKDFSKTGAESAKGRDSKSPTFSRIRVAKVLRRPRMVL